jgi:GNAT superfamily N-acetyltransferase
MSRGQGVVEIRPITSADAAAAAALSAQLGYPIDAAAMMTRIEPLAGAADHGVFVACRDGCVLGWVHVSAVHHLQSEPRAEIGGLVVAEGARSGGIGAMLVSRAEQWARDAGFATVVVRSQITRGAAHRFYLREGYTRTKTSAVFSKRLSDHDAHLASGSGRS